MTPGRKRPDYSEIAVCDIQVAGEGGIVVTSIDGKREKVLFVRTSTFVSPEALAAMMAPRRLVALVVSCASAMIIVAAGHVERNKSRH